MQQDVGTSWKLSLSCVSVTSQSVCQCDEVVFTSVLSLRVDSTVTKDSFQLSAFVSSMTSVYVYEHCIKVGEG